MGDVGLARHEPTLLPPSPTIRIFNYGDCLRSTHSSTLRVKNEVPNLLKNIMKHSTKTIGSILAVYSASISFDDSAEAYPSAIHEVQVGNSLLQP